MDATAPKKLSAKQQKFVEYYVRLLDATKAARLAGYKDPGQAGYENKKKQDISNAIQRLLREATLQPDDVLSRLTLHATSDMLDFVDDDGGVDISAVREAQLGMLIKKFKSTRRTINGKDDKEVLVERTVEIELYDAQSALVNLGRHHKLFTDKVEDDRVKALMDELADIRRRRSELARTRAGNKT